MDRQRKKAKKDHQLLRLEKAKASATDAIFLPNPGSVGVGKFVLDDEHVPSMKALQYLIIAKVERGVTWGEGGDNDRRRRMYAFVGDGRQDLEEEGILIQKEGAEDEREHEDTLKNSSVDLSFGGEKESTDTTNPSIKYLLCDPCIREALQVITHQVNGLVPGQYKQFATLEQLVAVQPNQHNGEIYLPLHLDYPRNDGFGVVIVTIVIRGSGWIVLLDEGDEDGSVPQSQKFFLEEGGAYILCGDARNKNLHGVWCESDSNRETLNLRYGLHSEEFAVEEIAPEYL